MPWYLKGLSVRRNILRRKDDECGDLGVPVNQWVTTDRSDLIKQTLPVDEFLSLVCEKLNAIKQHS